MPDRMEFCLLGPLAVRCNGVCVPLARGKQRALLVVLLLRAGRTVPVDELAELLWAPAAPPPAATATVRNYVKRLRHALGPAGPARIITQPGGYLIRVGPGELDVSTMEQELSAARRAVRDASWQRAARHAAAALGMWRGEPLSDVGLLLLSAQEAVRLAELRLQASELRIEAELELAQHAEVLTELRQLSAASPLREKLHALLMLALYRCGRRAEALEAYRQARAVLIEEIGSEPGPELQALHQQVLADDDALAPQAARPRPAAQGAPRQLPATARFFTGREPELTTLNGLISAQPGQAAPGIAITAISGTAGVGKTALAIQWAHQAADQFPDGQLYENLRGYDPAQPVSPADALAGFLAALGMPQSQIPEEARDRAAVYRSLLAGRRMLIVLDNARESEQVRPLLPGAPGCAVVVTSRNTMAGLVAREGAARLELDALPLGDAVALLGDLVGKRAGDEPEAAARLACLCCRLPLPLRVAAELAAARPGLSLTALADELAGQHGLDCLDAGGDQATAVRAAFSWSYRNLSVSAAGLFRLTALHPGTDFDTRAAAALSGASHRSACAALAELARAHLIEPAGADRYGMHDLLRAYGTELAADDGEDSSSRGLRHLFDYYLGTATSAARILYPADAGSPPAGASGDACAVVVTDERTSRAWLDAERANLTAVAVYAREHGWTGYAIGLSASLFRYLDNGAFLDEAMLIHHAASQAAVQAGDRAAEARAEISTGTVYLHRGQFQLAARHCQRALAASREVSDHPGQLRALGNLGPIYVRIGDYQSAVDCSQQALDLSRAAGDQTGEARALQRLGEAVMWQGRYRQAAVHLRAAARASRKVGDLACLTFALGSLGRVEVLRGCYREASSHLEEATAVSRRIGHVLGGANATCFLGLADLREGRYLQATQRLRQALTVFHEAGATAAEAHVMCLLGETDLHLGKPRQAAASFEQALAIFRETATAAGEAEARNGLGETALAEGAPAEASAHHQTALAIAGQLSSLEQQARAHFGLGNVSATAGDAARACRHWHEALALYTELGSPDAGRLRAKLAAATRASRRPG